MIELVIVTLAFAGSLGYVWRYYQRRLRRRVETEGPASQAARGCPPGCSGCPRN